MHVSKFLVTCMFPSFWLDTFNSIVGIVRPLASVFLMCESFRLRASRREMNPVFVSYTQRQKASHYSNGSKDDPCPAGLGTGNYFYAPSPGAPNAYKTFTTDSR